MLSAVNTAQFADKFVEKGLAAMKTFPASSAENLDFFRRAAIISAMGEFAGTLTDFVLSIDLFQGYGTLAFANDPKFTDFAGQFASLLAELAGLGLNPYTARDWTLNPASQAKFNAVMQSISNIVNQP